MKSLDKKIQTLNVDIKNQVQLLAQQISGVQKTLATIIGKNFNQPHTGLPSSSLSCSDIEIIDMPSKKQ